MNFRTIVLALVLLAAIGRFAFALLTPIAPREAYYALCADHPAPAYFDGPPGTAMTIRAMESIGVGDQWWRAISTLWTLAASAAVFLLARNLVGERAALWTILALNILPIFNIEGVRAGPLIPALTFASLAFLCIRRINQASDPALGLFALSGLAFAAGSQFLYAVSVFSLFSALFLLITPRHRTPKDILGALILLAIVAASLFPALRWNARQDWIPIAGGTLRTLWEFKMLEFLWSFPNLFSAISPVFVVILPIAWIWSASLSRQHPRQRFVFILTIPAVLGWLYFALRGEPGSSLLLLGTPLLLAAFAEWLSLRKPDTRNIWLSLALISGLTFSLAQLNTERFAGNGWAEAIDEALAPIEGEPGLSEGLFFIASTPGKASILSHYLKDDVIPPEGHPPVYQCESQDISSQFGLWPSYDDFVESTRVVDEYYTEQKGENPFVGRSAIYFTEEPQSDLPQAITAAFESVSLLHRIPRAGRDRKPLFIYLCRNYQTMPL